MERQTHFIHNEEEKQRINIFTDECEYGYLDEVGVEDRVDTIEDNKSGHMDEYNICDTIEKKIIHFTSSLENMSSKHTLPIVKQINTYNDLKHKINHALKHISGIENNSSSSQFGENENTLITHHLSSDDESSMCSDNEIHPIYEQFNEDEIVEIEEMMNEWLDEYFQENILYMSNPHFQEIMVEHITQFIYEDWLEGGICVSAHYDEIREWVNEIANVYYTQSDIPPRYIKPNEMDDGFIRSKTHSELETKIHRLKNVYQPTQKTPEWYQYRHNILTASNVWKALGNESQVNSLIFEKCKPRSEMADMTQTHSIGQPHSTNPMHWGIRYEPVSIMLYERKYNTKISDFGCITHPTYSFLGASPDGINVDTQSDLYGRMIEVKNIVNREIDGNPSEAYWIQMQLQMEVCDLDECDFIETRFVEYDNPFLFYQDVSALENSSSPYHNRGIILYMIPRVIINQNEEDKKDSKETRSIITSNIPTSPKYIYMDVNIYPSRTNVETWMKQQKELNPEYVVYHTIYWKLDEFSCVFVRRNSEWFKSAFPKIEECWNFIVKEREEGYEHRAPQSKKKMPPLPTEVIHANEETNIHTVKNMPDMKHVCLVKL